MSLVKIRNWSIAIAMVFSIGGVLATSAIPQHVSAAADPCNSGFLGFPAWYRGMTDADCNIESPGSGKDDLSNFIWHIGLNVVEIALVAVVYIASFLTLYGGFLFITSRGNPEGAARARMTILNSVIGLLISLVASFSIDFIIGRLWP